MSGRGECVPQPGYLAGKECGTETTANPTRAKPPTPGKVPYKRWIAGTVKGPRLR